MRRPNDGKMGTATKEALNTPDLLCHIFSYLDNADLRSVSLVQRSFTSEAYALLFKCIRWPTTTGYKSLWKGFLDRTTIYEAMRCDSVRNIDVPTKYTQFRAGVSDLQSSLPSIIDKRDQASVTKQVNSLLSAFPGVRRITYTNEAYDGFPETAKILDFDTWTRCLQSRIILTLDHAECEPHITQQLQLKTDWEGWKVNHIAEMELVNGIASRRFQLWANHIDQLDRRVTCISLAPLRRGGLAYEDLLPMWRQPSSICELDLSRREDCISPAVLEEIGRHAGFRITVLHRLPVIDFDISEIVRIIRTHFTALRHLHLRFAGEGRDRIRQVEIAQGPFPTTDDSPLSVVRIEYATGIHWINVPNHLLAICRNLACVGGMNTRYWSRYMSWRDEGVNRMDYEDEGIVQEMVNFFRNLSPEARFHLDQKLNQTGLRSLDIDPRCPKELLALACRTDGTPIPLKSQADIRGQAGYSDEQPAYSARAPPQDSQARHSPSTTRPRGPDAGNSMAKVLPYQSIGGVVGSPKNTKSWHLYGKEWEGRDLDWNQ